MELFANSGDTDHMQCSVASDLGLHYLPITLLGVSRLQWVKASHENILILYLPFCPFDIPRKDIFCLAWRYILNVNILF